MSLDGLRHRNWQQPTLEWLVVSGLRTDRFAVPIATTPARVAFVLVDAAPLGIGKPVTGSSNAR